MKVGFIGFGRLGSHLAKFLRENADILVYDSDQTKKELVENYELNWAESLKQLAQCQILIPFVPISEFETVIKEISPFLNEHHLVIDVCSVKVIPTKVMLEHLPKSLSLLGTHPMFGPDSTKETLFGAKIVLCPIRISPDRYQEIKMFLNQFGLHLIESTPEEHDRQIAETLVLPHLIGRTLLEFGSKREKIDTLGYKRLLKILGVVENDSWQLFQDMNKYNPYAKNMRDKFMTSLQSVLTRVEQ